MSGPTLNWSEAELPFRHKEKSLYGLNYSPQQLEWIKAGVAALKPDGRSLILLGPRGTGKTQIAVEIARSLDHWLLQEVGDEYRWSAGFMRYWSLPDLIAAEKASWDSQAPSPIAQAAVVPLLIIDEFDDLRDTDYEKRELTTMFDRRYRADLRTIFIGNVKPEELRGVLGNSITSRLKETARLIVCNGQVFRGNR